MRPRKNISYAIENNSSEDERDVKPRSKRVRSTKPKVTNSAEDDEDVFEADDCSTSSKRTQKTRKSQKSNDEDFFDYHAGVYPLNDPIDERISDAWPNPEQDLNAPELFTFMDGDENCVLVKSQGYYSSALNSRDMKVDVSYVMTVTRFAIKENKYAVGFCGTLMTEHVVKALPHDGYGPMPTLSEAREIDRQDEYYRIVMDPSATYEQHEQHTGKKLKFVNNRLDASVSIAIEKRYKVGDLAISLPLPIVTPKQYRFVARDRKLYVYLDLKEFVSLVEKGENVDFSFIPDLVSLVRERARTALERRYVLNDISIPDTANDAETEPSLGFGLTLRDYQKRTLGWMMNAENHVNARTLFVDPWPLQKLLKRYVQLPVQNGYYLDMINEKLIRRPNLKELPKYGVLVEKVTSGIILADDTGSGKTCTVLALIHTNPFKSINDITWDETSAADHIPSRATLVVCPSHLAVQWKLEAQRCMPGAKILLITTVIHHRAFTWNDLLFADLVIVSVSFLQNENYKADLSRVQTTTALPLRKREHFGEMKNVDLEKILWHRLVLDEFHEYLVYNERRHKHRQAFQELRESFRARFYIGVTGIALYVSLLILGTPNFTTNDDIIKVGNYFRIPLDEDSVQPFIQKLVRRNVPDLQLPPIIQHVKWVDLSAPEMAIYATYQSIMACNHYAIDSDIVDAVGNNEFLSLQEVTELIQKRRYDEIDSLKRQIEQLHVTLQITMADKELPKLEKDAKIARTKASITRAYGQMTTTQSQATFFDAVLKSIQKGDDLECLICLENIGAGNEISITSCGHVHCVPCIKRVFTSGYGRCSACRSPISESKCATMTIKANEPEPVAPVEELSPEGSSSQEEKVDYDKYGSKVGALVQFLMEKEATEPDSKIILFVQYHSLAQKISRSLTDFSIPHTRCAGNVMQRTKAIQDFRQKKDVRVIMLSAEDSVSGLHLVEANYVIVFHPFQVGTNEQGIDYEKQGIARAWRGGQSRPVNVVRFLTRNTVEQAIADRRGYPRTNTVSTFRNIADEVSGNYSQE